MNRGLVLHTRRTAVLTVDFQRQYLDPAVGGNLLPEHVSEQLTRRTAEMLHTVRSLGLPVVHAYVQRHPAEIAASVENSPYGLAGRRAGLSQNPVPQGARPPDRLVGSPQAELPAAIVGPDDIHVATKKTTDSFLGTELALLLSRVLRVDTVAVAGINTDTCVYAAVFGLSARGFRPVVLSDCVASTRGEDHSWMALELMSRSIAWVMGASEFTEKLRSVRSQQGASPRPSQRR